MSLPHGRRDEQDVDVHGHTGSHHDDDDGDDQGEAVVDFDDPDLAVLDETQLHDMAAEDEDEDDDDDDVVDGGGGGGSENEAEEEEAGGVDLNTMPDVEPERDDALATFAPPGRQPLHAVAVHPHDASLLAAAGEAEVVYILRLVMTTTTTEAATLTRLHTLTGHSDTVSQLAFSPDGAWLASAGLDGKVAVWSTQTWACVHVLDDVCGEVMSLLWHPSSLILVASADEAQMAMWNVLKGVLLMHFAGHTAAITCVAWSSDHKRLLSGGSDGTLIVYNPKTAEQVVRVTGSFGAADVGITVLCVPAITTTTTTSAAAAANSDRCVVGCDDGTLHVVSLRTGKVVVHMTEVHTQAIEVLRGNEAGTLLMSASCDCRVVVWNVVDYSVRVVLDVGESVVAAQWLGGYTVVAGCSDGSVRAWDGRAATQTPKFVRLGHRRLVLALATAHMASAAADQGDGKGGGLGCAVGVPLLVSASDDGSVRVFSGVAAPSTA